jgi:hypothetical protein
MRERRRRWRTKRSHLNAKHSCAASICRSAKLSLLPEGCLPPGRLCYLISSRSARITRAITNRQSTAIVMITRIQDDFSSKGLTSLHWNGPQVVALSAGRWLALLSQCRGCALHSAVRQLQTTFCQASQDSSSQSRTLPSARWPLIAPLRDHESTRLFFANHRFAPDQLQPFFARMNAAFELRVFCHCEHLFEAWAGGVTGSDQVASGDEQRRPNHFVGELFPSPFGELPERKIAMAGERVDAVEFEVFVEMREAEEALERGLLHLLDVAEAHVIFDEGENLGAVLVGKAQAAQDFVGDADADLDVAVEADAVGRLVGEGGGLADVVEERAPGEGRRHARRKFFKEQEGVDPHIALGMVLGRLLDAVEFANFGQHFFEQTCPVQRFECAAGVAFCEHAGELVADAFAADLSDSGGELADGALGFRFDGEVEAGGETHGAEHAQLVFFKAAVGLANGADDAVAEIVFAADVIQNRRREAAGLAMEDGVEHHAVNGEVAAEDVFLGARGKADLGGVAAVAIRDVAAKCSNLGDNFLIVNLVADQHNAEVGPDGEGAREQGEDRIGMGAGGNVEVLGRDAEENVADAAAGEVRLVTGGAQLDDDALCGELCRPVGHCDSPVSSWRTRFKVDAFEPRWDSDDTCCLLG